MDKPDTSGREDRQRRVDVVLDAAVFDRWQVHLMEKNPDALAHHLVETCPTLKDEYPPHVAECVEEYKAWFWKCPGFRTLPRRQ